MKVPITRPLLSKEEEEAVVSVLQSGWLVQGANVEAFEKAITEYVGGGYAVAVSSCTTALHLALILGGISKGDEVLVPAFTHTASANVIEYQGATPVFVDIDLNTFNMSTRGVAKSISKDTKAIMPVHLFGLCADMSSILNLASRYDLFVVEDAACALGSSLAFSKDEEIRYAGTMGVGCFSFHPRKVITTGEGGILLTDHPEMASAARSLRAFGMAASTYKRQQAETPANPTFENLGYNYRMTDIQGAIGVVQMRRLEGIIAKRHMLAARYNEALSHVPGIQLPIEPIGYKHIYQSYVLLITEEFPLPRDEVTEKLHGQGVATRSGAEAVPMLAYYCEKYGYTEQDFPNAITAEKCSLVLPLYPQMTAEEQDYVIEAIWRLSS